MTKTPPQPQTQAVATTTSKAMTLRDHLEADGFKEAVKRALPRHLTVDRFLRAGITCLTKTPKLAVCTEHSFLNCMLQLSQLGLEPDGRRAHLIPFENRAKKTVECTLIIDYKGLAELAMRSGTLASPPFAEVVCENDVFEWNKGKIINHIVDWKKPRGLPYAAYSIVFTKDEGESAMVMPKDDIYKVRDKSAGYRAFKAGLTKECPWVDDQAEPEMWKKTVFRRHSKWLTLSPEYRDAIDLEDNEETRFQNAKPVIGTVTTPVDFQIPDAPHTETAEQGGNQDGDLGPQGAEKTATTGPEKEVKPEPVKETPQPKQEPAKTSPKPPATNATTAAPTPPVSNAPEPTGQQSVEDARALVKMISEINVLEDTFLRWLKETGKVSTPLSNIAELAECAPRKLRALTSGFATYRASIIEFAAKK